MAHDLFKSCIVFISFYATIEAKSHLEDCIWRDYEGMLPSDALANGFDKNGRIVYIGQVLYENNLIPGKILSNDDKIYFEWNNQEKSTNKNVKILCTSHADNFFWMSTKSNEVPLLANKILIKGGYEPNYSTYIGRVFENEETSIGKVICSSDDCLGLYTTSNGSGKLYKNFMVLVYNPDDENISWNQ